VDAIIKKLIQAHAEESFDNIAQEYLSQNRKAGAKGSNTAARKHIKNKEKAGFGKLPIVSGKELLAELFEWSQKKYAVSLSVASIIDEMSLHEIHPEVINIITKIEDGLPFPNDNS